MQNPRPSTRSMLLPPSALTSRRGTATGFSLVEMMVALAIFVLVILAAFQVYQRSNEGFKRGQNQAEVIESVRVGYEQMLGDIRLAGFEYDLDGDKNAYPNAPDEPIEFMGLHSITVRGNYDFGGGPLHGRELGLENHGAEGSGSIESCCPVVTTSNDEVVTFALGKNPGTAQPPGTMSLVFDTSGTEDEGDTSFRDASITPAGVITGEENVTINQIETRNVTDAGYDPPYVLYRITVKEDGTLERLPVVDNVRSMTFTYFDAGDNVINPNGGADGGRAARALIRKIRISLQGMEPEQDLRWKDYQDPLAETERHRKFTLTTDVVPPNLARRGQVDKTIGKPDPVTNVAICTGQCGMVRVSWIPAPAEAQIIDHVVSLFTDAGPNHAANAKIASFIVTPDYDTVPDPDEEFAVFTREDDPSIVNGITVWGQVVARDAGGAEADPAESVTNPVASKRSGVIGDQARPEGPKKGGGSGYNNADAQWPDAKRNNVGGVTIITASANANYPQAQQITVTLKSPEFALNTDSSAPGSTTAQKWTVKENAAGSVAIPEACHAQEQSPNDATVNLRTPIEELPRNESTKNVYVFRVSGNDPWNWGTGVTDPRNFIPSAANLYDFTHLDLGGGNTTYADRADSEFVEGSNGPGEYQQRFNRTSFHLKASGQSASAPAALVAGEVYYYRFRAVDICWADTNSDGVRDGSAPQMTAWSKRTDFADDVAWRTAALQISNFYPPLDNNGGSAGNRDRPNQSVHDSDVVTGSSYALPAYAIAAANGASYFPPERPTDLYLWRRDANGNGASDAGDNLRIVLNTSKRNENPDAAARKNISIVRYELYRREASQPDTSNLSSSDLDFAPTPGLLQQTLWVYGDSATPKSWLPYLHYTIDTPAEGAKDDPALDTSCGPSGTTCNPIATDTTRPWVYRVVASQASSYYDTTSSSSTNFDDSINTTSGEKSAPSPPFVYPCKFYEDVTNIVATPSSSTDNRPVAVTVSFHDTQNNSTSCAPVKTARLLGFNSVTGEYVGSSRWIDTNPPSCDFTFNSSRVTEARNGASGGVLYVPEVSNDTRNTSSPNNPSDPTDIPFGCRKRTSTPGIGIDNSGVCDVQCKDNHNRGLCPLNTQMVDDVNVSLVASGANPNRTVRITFHQTCPSCSLAISEIHVSLTDRSPRVCNASNRLPLLTSAQVAHANGNDVLPTNVAHEDFDKDESASCRRQYDWETLDTGSDPDILVANGETFSVELTFDADMSNTQITVLQLMFGDPLPNASNGRDPVCQAPSMPLRVPNTGACCLGPGSCEDVTSATCSDDSGSFQGPDTTCAGTSC